MPRYHFWIDPESLQVWNAIGYKTPTLYKNPPLGVRQFQPEYFNTRKLDCSRGPSKLLVEAAMRVVREDGLLDKARQAAEQEVKDQVAAEEEWQIKERARARRSI
jgi:hypothetical protein